MAATSPRELLRLLHHQHQRALVPLLGVQQLLSEARHEAPLIGARELRHVQHHACALLSDELRQELAGGGL